MLRDAALKAGKYALIFTGIALLSIVIIAYAYSVITNHDFITALRTCTLYAGVVLIGIGALMGMGSAEVAYSSTNNPVFMLTGPGQKAGTEGRLERRRQQFFVMILLVIVGLLFIVISLNM